MTAATYRLIPGWCVWVICACLLGGREGSAAEVDPAAVLKAAGVAVTPAGVEAYLRDWIVDDRLRDRLQTLITQLGSEDFEKREQASAELGRIGRHAIEPLRKVIDSDDAEVRMRARELLTKVDSGESRSRREALLLAALQWQEQQKPAGATPLLLDVLPHLPGGVHREAATLALWASARPADAARLRQAVREGSAVLRAAALPALELAEGERAVDLIQGYRKDADPAIRLGAARALLVRQPRAALTTLIGLLDGDDVSVRGQAARLLQIASGIPGNGERSPEWKTAVQRWKKWAASPDIDRARPVGLARLKTDRYGLLLSVQFIGEVPAIRDSYPMFRFETNVLGKASVTRGRLRLGDQRGIEGDLRLYVTAEKLLGQATFPKAFQVKATLGGEDQLAGAWHVAVSVGNLRILFHPGLPQGAFRVERIDNHAQLHENENMPFTPVAGVLHDMTIDVRDNPDGTVTLDVRIVEGGGGKGEFHRTVTVAAGDIGPRSRVGLERSGREGGAGLFGSLIIRH